MTTLREWEWSKSFIVKDLNGQPLASAFNVINRIEVSIVVPEGVTPPNWIDEDADFDYANQIYAQAGISVVMPIGEFAGEVANPDVTFPI